MALDCCGIFGHQSSFVLGAFLDKCIQQARVDQSLRQRRIGEVRMSYKPFRCQDH
jgi:hypothetical protein